MAYFKDTLETVRELAGHLNGISAAGAVVTPSGPPSGPATTGAGRIDPAAVVEALAEGLKSDNSHTQAIAIRVGNLATKYDKRAF